MGRVVDRSQAVVTEAVVCPLMIGMTIASSVLVLKTAINDWSDFYRALAILDDSPSMQNLTLAMQMNPGSAAKRSLLFTGIMVAGAIVACVVPKVSDVGNAMQEEPPPDMMISPDALTSSIVISLTIPSFSSVPLPVPGSDYPEDGCPRDFVSSQYGICFPLTVSCDSERWLLIEETTYRGICAPKVCPEGMVYSQATRTCHDVFDPNLCSESNQRAYVTSSGRTVCYCLEGYLQDSEGKCHQLFSRGPCSPIQVWVVGPKGTPICSDGECPPNTAPIHGACAPLGSDHVCPGNLRVGISYESGSGECVPADTSPPSGSIFGTETVRRRSEKTWKTKWQSEKPVSVSLLLPCMPGARRNFNWKCRTLISVYEQARRIRSPSPPNFQCPEESVLTFNGMCQDSSTSVECPPGFDRGALNLGCTFNVSSIR